jgi:predicted transcriptional regulator
MATASPPAARAVLSLYKAYQASRAAADDLTSRLTEGEELVDRSHLPSEEVSDLVQRSKNYFPEIEDGAAELIARAKLTTEDLYPGLIRHLEKSHGIKVQIAPWGDEKGTLRRYDPERKLLILSELLPTRSRTFQLAYQLGVLTLGDRLEKLTADPYLTTDESRTLAKVALANYFAGAVLMPYATFLKAAQSERYDVDVLGRRFRVGFEQVCHRLTSLRRPGQEGVPFHMIRIDVAGNI